MIAIDFFGCKPEQIAACPWEDACDRFPYVGITIPSASALISLSAILTGIETFSAKPVATTAAQFYEVDDRLKVALTEATAVDLLNAGARWAELPPWDQVETNPMEEVSGGIRAGMFFGGLLAGIVGGGLAVAGLGTPISIGGAALVAEGAGMIALAVL